MRNYLAHHTVIQLILAWSKKCGFVDLTTDLIIKSSPALFNLVLWVFGITWQS
jgi:hypothetical protein